MSDKIYCVRTELFGVIRILAPNIKAARMMALRYGVRHPRLVWRETRHSLCTRCDSVPCCCGDR